MTGSGKVEASRSQGNLSTRLAALQAIRRIEHDSAFVDIVLSQLLERTHFEKRDRAFISELVRGTIRWKKRLDWIVRQLLQPPSRKCPDDIRWILWLGLYQILFMRIKTYAAVNESVDAAKSLVRGRWAGVVNAILRSYLRAPDRVVYPDMRVDPVAGIAVRWSFPEWLVRRWITRWGIEKTTALCRASNDVPVLSVRHNRLRCSTETFERRLSETMEFRPSIVPYFYRLARTDFVTLSQLLDDGYLTVQDESAGLPSLLADPQPGTVICDLCAAPGGKATHLAELCDEQAKIVAGDISVPRLHMVQHSVERLSLRSVFPVSAEAQCFPVKTADIVLLDAPCSGLGVLRRKPDIRWRRTEQDIEDLISMQKKLLLGASNLVTEGGSLIYSTCTVEPEENEGVVDAFLSRHREFRVVEPEEGLLPQTVIAGTGAVRTWPHEHDMDGSYAIRMKKVTMG